MKQSIMMLGATLLIGITSDRIDAVGYTYTTIADRTQGFSMFVPRTDINDAGQVAFTAELVDGGSVILRGDGLRLTTLVDTRRDDVAGISSPVLNNLGQVAFVGSHTDNSGPGSGEGTAIFLTERDDDDDFDAIVSTRGPLREFSLPSLNNRGQVAFMGIPDDRNLYNVYVGDDEDDPRLIVETPLAPRGRGLPPHVNDVGHIAFQAALTPPSQLPTVHGVFLHRDGVTTRLADTTAGSPFEAVDNAVLNARDEVAFHARLRRTEGQSYADEAIVVAQPDGTLAHIVDTLGPYAVLSHHDLNDRGRLVFEAGLDGQDTGIFTGPDPDRDAVVRVGDLLNGSTVIGTGLGGINDAGQVAFWAILADGSSGIFRADPLVPEPAALTTLLGAGVALFARRRRARATAAEHVHHSNPTHSR